MKKLPSKRVMKGDVSLEWQVVIANRHIRNLLIRKAIGNANIEIERGVKEEKG